MRYSDEDLLRMKARRRELVAEYGDKGQHHPMGRMIVGEGSEANVVASDFKTKSEAAKAFARLSKTQPFMTASAHHATTKKIVVRKVGSRWQPVDSSGTVMRGAVYNADGTGYSTREGAAEAAEMLRHTTGWGAHPVSREHATIAESPGGKPSKEKLQQAAKWIRREITKRDDGSHPSHLASKVLEEADDKFGLGSYGVEGWAKSPRLGYQYLNYGDPYDPTIVVRSNPTQATVFVALGGWASYAGH